jgi:hypothetical protein
MPLCSQIATLVASACDSVVVVEVSAVVVVVSAVVVWAVVAGALGEMDAVADRATMLPGSANVPAAGLYISKGITWELEGKQDLRATYQARSTRDGTSCCMVQNFLVYS